MTRFSLLLAALALAGCASPEPASPPPPAAVGPAKRAECALRPVAARGELETRRYRLTAAEVFDGAAPEAALEAIVSFVAPGTWGPEHGTALYWEGEDLVGRHGGEVLARVEEAIGILRERRGRKLQLTARFASLPDGDARPLECVAPASGGLADVFDSAALARVEAEWRKAPVQILSAPRLTLFHGQSGSITVASEYAYISGFERHEGAGAVVHDPVISIAREGFTLEAVAISNGGRADESILSFRLEWNVVPRRDGRLPLVRFGNLAVELPWTARSAVSGILTLRDGQGAVLMLSTPDPETGRPSIMAVLLELQWLE
jgi:hypothetical protein